MGQSWTREQQKVIDTRDKDILVSAAAGSGKTAVLVERIIKRITDTEHPTDIDRLLVVTFTKAAAAEMRERVRLAIDKMSDEMPEDANLLRQSSLIHNAMITTIDSFCLFIVRNHFEEINLDPNFRIADEGEICLLKTDVMQALFEEEYTKGKEQNASFFSLIDTYSGKRNDSGVREMVEKLYDLSASSPWPKEWLDGLTKTYAIDCEDELQKTPLFFEMMEHTRQMLLDLYALEQHLYELTQEPDGPEKYASALAADLAFLEKACKQKSFEELQEVVCSYNFEKLPPIRSKDGDASKKDAVKNGRDAVKGEIIKLKSFYFQKNMSEIFEQVKRIRPFVVELVRLAKRFTNAMDEQKKKKRILDFSDIEHFALKILVDEQTKEHRPTAEEFRHHFDEIMIDEYQDSNQVQEAILCAISGRNNGAHNMFMVGDVKQSIYRFRMARPELFMEKYKAYEQENEEHVKIDLHKNFRSREQVLDFSNDIFYKIMQADLGQVAYDEDAALYCGASYEKVDGFEAELLLFDCTESLLDEAIGGEGAASLEEKEELTQKELEARVVGLRIQKLMQTAQITDKETGLLRKVRYSDIVILFRSLKEWGTTFANVLTEMGIPAHVESSTGYFSAIEVQTILNMLRILDNPNQDIPMAAVLKSPMVGLDNEELAQISARNADSDKKRPFYALAMEEMQQASEGPLQEFYQIFCMLRKEAKELPIHELILRILSVTGYRDYVTMLPAGQKRAANVQMLIEKAIAYERTSYKGLFHFIRYIDLLEKYDIDYGEADVTGENADVVHIMTIHKSKGLEFPVVFVSGLSKKFNMSDTSDKLVVHTDLGIGLTEIRPNPKRKVPGLIKAEISEHLKREALGEELRMLYVALTRAKEKLILTGVVKDRFATMEKYTGNVTPKKPITYMQRAKAACYLDWVIPALLSYPDKYDVCFVDSGELIWESAKDLAKEHLDYHNLIAKIEAVSDEQLEELVSAFSYEYPHKSEADLKIKYSVSELKHMSMREKYDADTREAERPDFLLEEKESFVPEFAKSKEKEPAEEVGEYARNASVNPGALRGTAVHRVMECLDFARILTIHCENEAEVKQFVEEELLRMEREDELPPEMRALINRRQIETFVKSDIATQMAKAAQKGCLFKEKPFVMKYNEVLVQGIIDVFWMEEDGIVVLDYKTDRVNTADELVLRYQTQLSLYAEALSRIFSDETKTIPTKESLIYSFSLQEVVRL